MGNCQIRFELVHLNKKVSDKPGTVQTDEANFINFQHYDELVKGIDKTLRVSI